MRLRATLASWFLVALAPASPAYAAPLDADGEVWTRGWLDAYARAAKLHPLGKPGARELRVWVEDVMTARVTGYVVTETRSMTCRTWYRLSGPATTVRPAHCKSVGSAASRQRVALDMVEELAALDRQEFSCGVMDGDAVLVEGESSGGKFFLVAVNPESCQDPGSLLVAKLLKLLL